MSSVILWGDGTEEYLSIGIKAREMVLWGLRFVTSFLHSTWPLCDAFRLKIYCLFTASEFHILSY